MFPSVDVPIDQNEREQLPQDLPPTGCKIKAFVKKKKRKQKRRDNP